MRDLIGYGENPPVVTWPHGAKVAVSLVLNYEEGAESSIEAGDELDEDVSIFGGWSADPSRRSLMKESFFEYGSRVGIWRYLGMLREYNLQATVMACGAALERNPEAARAIVRDGHEICAHGYKWRGTVGMEPDEERREIRKSLAAVEAVSGVRPVGWYVREGITENTRTILAEEGVLYDSNSYADDLPYYVQAGSHPHLVVPYSGDTNDARFWGNGSLGTGEDFFNVLKDTLDCLLIEGETVPKMMSVGLHLRIGGRPSVAHGVRRFLEYALAQTGVWFATREEIARWWKEHPPVQSEGIKAQAAFEGAA
ncbi:MULTISPECIES: polysaccharide deacetylase family protein [Paenarthrobacter]|uniref:Polysaccharide deacetylase family protein n=1 Tax=Paenarthrobacter aromaticivorans TaxID=2849150 RepID=A0ABS6HZ00_9MICC|nr:polysaccharide deacetylase family protein [Paenarthrobacter sp. MMS21-TAE1-1]MBU8864720.1 polysaccharide deacetylase family protein [Paenarthrobacter sp. MMS21-TAE1-1]